MSLSTNKQWNIFGALKRQNAFINFILRKLSLEEYKLSIQNDHEPSIWASLSEMGNFRLKFIFTFKATESNSISFAIAEDYFLFMQGNLLTITIVTHFGWNRKVARGPTKADILGDN